MDTVESINVGLQKENAELHSENANIKSDNVQIRKENAQIRAENVVIRKENAKMKAEIAEVQKENVQMRSENAEMKGEELVRMTPNKNGGANHGHSCVKGRFAWGYATHKDRITTPMIRKSIHDPWEEVSWDEAINYAAKEISRIQKKYGTEAVGAINSSRCTNEETYLVQKLVRAGFGNNNSIQKQDDHGPRIKHQRSPPRRRRRPKQRRLCRPRLNGLHGHPIPIWYEHGCHDQCFEYWQ